MSASRTTPASLKEPLLSTLDRESEVPADKVKQENCCTRLMNRCRARFFNSQENSAEKTNGKLNDQFNYPEPMSHDNVLKDEHEVPYLIKCNG